MEKGKKHTEETKRKIAEANKGKKKVFSSEAIERIRLAAKKRRGKCFNPPMGEAQKQRIREANSRPKSEEHKRKIAETLSGRTNPEQSLRMKEKIEKGQFHLKPLPKGTIPWNKGIRYGKSPKRKGTLFIIWREKVKERDGYKCTTCGSNYRLAAHHIIPWREREDLRFDVNNGISLCASCHGKLEGYQLGHKPKPEILEKTRKTKLKKRSV